MAPPKKAPHNLRPRHQKFTKVYKPYKANKERWRNRAREKWEKERGEKDRAEFAIEHPMAVSRDDSPLFCLKCHGGEPDHRWNDPRHAYTPDDWRRDAREQWDAEQAAKVTPK